METTNRKVDWLTIDLLKHIDRKIQSERALTLEERTRRAIAKGDALLAQARLSANLRGR